MRVLYFSRDYSTHDHRFLSALAGTGHDVAFLRLECGNSQADDRPVPENIRQVQWAGAEGPFRWRDVPRLVGGLRRVLRDVRPDLVHAGPIQTCAFLVALAGFRPLLTMSWGFDLMRDSQRNAWWAWVTRYTLQRSTYFVSDAEVTRSKAIGYGMNAARTAVFPWGVDLQHFAPERARHAEQSSVGVQRRSRRQTDQPFVIFCNRSWEPQYGVDVLARAFVHVARERPEATLLLVGAGSLAQSLRQILMAGQVIDRVQLPGRVSQADLPRWYRMADLYVSPSHVDGSSVSLMEALACGLPALVSDIPANKEWVIEGVQGWLFPDGDAAALAECLLKIMDDRQQLPLIAHAARRTAEEKADWARNFRVLLDVYERAARNGDR